MLQIYETVGKRKMNLDLGLLSAIVTKNAKNSTQKLGGNVESFLKNFWKIINLFCDCDFYIKWSLTFCTSIRSHKTDDLFYN